MLTRKQYAGLALAAFAGLVVLVGCGPRMGQEGGEDSGATPTEPKQVQPAEPQEQKAPDQQPSQPETAASTDLPGDAKHSDAFESAVDGSDKATDPEPKHGESAEAQKGDDGH